MQVFIAVLSGRNGIGPVSYTHLSAWKTANIRPGNLPRLRIAQLASFLSQHDFVFEQLLACRTRQEVNRLFRTEASPYWSGARQTPEGPEENPKRVGQMCIRDRCWSTKTNACT